MTAPKKPQDHKKPAKSLAENPDIAVTVRDVEWTIEAEALNDWELLEDLNDPSGGSAPSAMRRFLGPEQYDKAKDLVRDPHSGRVPADAMSEFIGELFEAVGESGNP